MRATKGYAAGVGTTGALVGAIGCAFAILSAVVAVHGWPLTLSAPSVRTLDDRRVTSVDAPVPRLLGAFDATSTARPATRADTAARRLATADRQRDGTPRAGEPFAGLLDPVAGGGGRGTRGSSGARPQIEPGASAAGTPPTPSAPLPAAPVAPPARQSTGTGGSSTPPPAGSDSGSSGLGGAVAQVTTGAGTVVTQTGQQLGGAVQGATGQLGGAVGQVSPAAGQVVAQTGQLAGGVVSGAAGAAGQVVAGAGTAVGGLLGGLGRAGARRSP